MDLVEDREVVAGLMEAFVDHLLRHWKDESDRVQAMWQRGLKKAKLAMKTLRAMGFGFKLASEARAKIAIFRD